MELFEQILILRENELFWLKADYFRVDCTPHFHDPRVIVFVRHTLYTGEPVSYRVFAAQTFHH